MVVGGRIEMLYDFGELQNIAGQVAPAAVNDIRLWHRSRACGKMIENRRELVRVAVVDFRGTLPTSAFLFSAHNSCRRKHKYSATDLAVSAMRICHDHCAAPDTAGTRLPPQSFGFFVIMRFSSPCRPTTCPPHACALVRPYPLRTPSRHHRTFRFALSPTLRMTISFAGSRTVVLSGIPSVRSASIQSP